MARVRAASGLPRQEGLVTAPVENRSGVVAHPPVDRDIGAVTGDLLHRPHPVEGDGRRGHDGPPRLGRHPNGVGDARPAAGLLHRGGPLGHGRCFLAVDIGDTEAPTHHQLGQAERREELGQHLDGLGERGQGEDLAAQVGMDSAGSRRRPWRPARSACRPPRLPLPTPRRSRTSCRPGRCARTRGCAPRHPGSPGPTPGPVAPPDRSNRTPVAPDGRSRRRSRRRSGPHRRSRAVASSSSDLLLPWRTRRSGGTPADRATCISPPVETSSRSPSSWANRAMARHRNALVA